MSFQLEVLSPKGDYYLHYIDCGSFLEALEELLWVYRENNGEVGNIIITPFQKDS